MVSKRKNSLVNNINRRKRAGKSRPKSKSTVSAEAYRDMRQGWPRSRKKTASKSGSKRKATKRQGGRKAAKKK
jgi:hypothetical protein